MKALIFSEGNGYGHAARDKVISDRFGFPIMTFGKGAEYCRTRSMDFIEIPTPYVIRTGRADVKLVSEVKDVAGFLRPEALSAIVGHFKKVDTVIVDGTPLGLAIAMLARKRALYITNDITTLIGIHGVIERKVASSLHRTLLRSARAIIVPDFPPPLTVTMENLNPSFPLVFAGPLVERVRQVPHGKRYLVSGVLEKLVRPHLGDEAAYGGDVDFKASMADAELVISHGGHTSIMEALSHGKPVLCITENYAERRNNALALARNDVGVMLGRDMLTGDSLRSAIDYAATLNRQRLEVYKKAAARDPLKALESALLDA